MPPSPTVVQHIDTSIKDCGPFFPFYPAKLLLYHSHALARLYRSTLLFSPSFDSHLLRVLWCQLEPTLKMVLLPTVTPMGAVQWQNHPLYIWRAAEVSEVPATHELLKWQSHQLCDSFMPKAIKAGHGRKGRLLQCQENWLNGPNRSFPWLVSLGCTVP